MRIFVLVVSLLLLASSDGLTAEALVKDARTLRVAGTTYRLDGIDAPEVDQICINDQADPWACGIDVRDSLIKLIGNRSVTCRDVGPDAVYKGRRIGLCSFDDGSSLNQMLVREGFAINFEPSAAGRFAADQAEARQHRRGLWKGCFVAPEQFRRWDKIPALLGASCRPDKSSELIQMLFPEDAAMPPGCSIKAKFSARARFTGKIGIYHLESCRSYPTAPKPNRWFCSEEDAQAAGFRKAYNCRAIVRSR